MTLRARCILAIVWLLPLVGAAEPATRQSRMDIAKQLCEARLQSAGGKAIVSEYYPTEEALVFLSAYDFTRDARFAKQAGIQLEYCLSREKEGIFLTSAGTTTRDYQARHIYNFYLAYRILGDGRYLEWADQCAAAMLKLLPRSPHTVAGETHVLFEAGFLDAHGNRVKENGNVIDVNQNAEVAIAYSPLYHDPASRFFLSSQAKEIAYDELLASRSIQDMQTGLIPLTENIPGGDTAYGSYGAFSWVWCQLLWHEPKFETHVRAAGRWFAPMMNLQNSSQRWYPNRIENGIVPYWEANYRLPLLWYCGVDAQQFVKDLCDRMQKPDAVPGDRATAPLYWAYFDLMGVPRSYFINGETTPRHDEETR